MADGITLASGFLLASGGTLDGVASVLDDLQWILFLVPVDSTVDGVSTRRSVSNLVIGRGDQIDWVSQHAHHRRERCDCCEDMHDENFMCEAE